MEIVLCLGLISVATGKSVSSRVGVAQKESDSGLAEDDGGANPLTNNLHAWGLAYSTPTV